MSKVLISLFDEIGEEPVKAVVVDQESAILRLVADEVGLGIMPALKVDDVASGDGIFSIMHLERTLSLYLLSLVRRAEDPMIVTVGNLIKKIWE